MYSDRNSTFLLKPVIINHRVLITKIEIRIVYLALNHSVEVSVYFPENSYVIPLQNFVIEGQEYLNWLNDDTYLVRLILEKINSNETINVGDVRISESTIISYEGKFELANDTP